MAITFEAKKSKAKTEREKIMTRTRNLHHAHTQAMNRDAFSAEYKQKHPFKRLKKGEKSTRPSLDDFINAMPMSQRHALPFSLEFMRLKIDEALHDEKQHCCPYCGDELTADNFSLDHVMPTSRRNESGIEQSLRALGALVAPMLDEFSDDQLLVGAYSWDNMALCCISCNRRKGEMTLFDWEILREALGRMTVVSKSYVWKKLASVPLTFWRKGQAKQKATVSDETF